MKKRLSHSIVVKLLFAILFAFGSTNIHAQRISAGKDYVMYICPDSTISAIGRNYGYQLGDGTDIERHIPVKVKGLHNVVAVNAEGSMALLNDGTVWQWALNRENAFEKIDIDSVVAISAGIGNCNFYCALRSDGSLWMWGDADHKSNDWWGYTDTLERMDLPRVKKVVGGYYCVIALCEDGTVWTWGGDRIEGNGNLISYPNYQIINPQQVLSLSNIVDVAAGGFWMTGWALKDDGTVWQWGWLYDQRYPVKMNNSNIRKIYVGGTDTYNYLYSFTNSGELIRNTLEWGPDSKDTIKSIKKLVDVASGSSDSPASTYLLDSNDNIWRWGSNTYGQLGNFTTYPIDTPEVMPHKCLAVNCDTITKNPDVLMLDTLVYPGQPVDVEASLSEADLYWWYPQSNVISGKYSQKATVKIATTDVEFNAVLMDSYGCMRKERFMLRKLCPPEKTTLDTTTYPGATIPLNAGDGTSYTWSPTQGLSCNYCSNPLATINSPTTYTASYTDIYNCQAKENFIIRIRDCDTIVKAKDSLMVDTLVTPGSTNQLKASNAETYSWSPTTGLSCSSCQSPNARIFTNTEYTATMMDRYHCQWQERFKLTNWCDSSTLSNPPVLMDTVTYPQATLNFMLPVGRQYSWQPGTGLSCSNCKNPTATVTAPILYEADMVDSFQCSSKARFNIRIRDCDTIVTQNNIVRLDTVVHFTTNIPLTASESYNGYTWNPTTDLSCSDCQVPTFLATDSATYTVETYDKWRCPLNEIFKIAMVREDVIIPNVFTPNGDGINDYFEIKGLKPNSTLRVFNSNEILVFSSEQYDGSWNGTDSNGNKLAEGTYWYILNVPESGRYTGWVYLKR